MDENNVQRGGLHTTPDLSPRHNACKMLQITMMTNCIANVSNFTPAFSTIAGSCWGVWNVRTDGSSSHDRELGWYAERCCSCSQLLPTSGRRPNRLCWFSCFVIRPILFIQDPGTAIQNVGMNSTLSTFPTLHWQSYYWSVNVNLIEQHINTKVILN